MNGQKFIKHAGAKLRPFPTPSRAEKSNRKGQNGVNHKSAYSRPEYQAGAFDNYYVSMPNKKKQGLQNSLTNDRKQRLSEKQYAKKYGCDAIVQVYK